jgi:hypothetical protein
MAVLEIRGDNTTDSCVALQQLEHAAHEVPSVKRLGDEILEFDIVPQGRRREPRGEQAFEPGLPRRIVVMRSSGPGSRISSMTSAKGFASIRRKAALPSPTRHHREPLFGKDLSHQGPRSLVAVNDEDLTL